MKHCPPVESLRAQPSFAGDAKQIIQSAGLEKPFHDLARPQP
jgi:hypothetical protein